MSNFDLLCKDTICALATPRGQGAIAVIRVSGVDSYLIRDRVFKAKFSQKIVAFHTRLGHIFENSPENMIDEVLCTSFKQGKSYTGEDSFELSIHGGFVQSQRIVELLLKAGCRLAEAGEFTLRAVLHGKMDLASAEAVHDVVFARSERAADAAMRSLQSGLLKKLNPIRVRIVDALSEIEARFDFPDEDLEAIDAAHFHQNLDVALDELTRLKDSYHKGKKLNEGARIVLFGAPNAGKSTLLNALLNEERALVFDLPGTTRDSLEAEIIIEGIPCILIDVAGIRDLKEADPIEKLGIKRAQDEVAKADLVLLLCPPESSIEQALELLPEDTELKKVVLIKSKQDLILKTQKLVDVDVSTKESLIKSKLSHGIIEISALKTQDIQILEKKLVACMGLAEHEDEVILSRARQLEEVKCAIESLIFALKAIDDDAAEELISSELRTAGGALDRLLGKDLSEDVLDTIFTRFCIGK